MKVAVCPACNGKGIEEKCGGLVFGPCPDCGGTGLEKEPVEEVVLIAEEEDVKPRKRTRKRHKVA